MAEGRAAMLAFVPSLLAACGAFAQPFELLEDAVTTRFPLSFEPVGVTRAAGGVFFSALSRNEGQELWFLPGGSARASLVADLNPSGDGMTPSGILPAMHELGGRLVFDGAQSAGRINLWSTDGTAAGTFQLADLVAVGDNYPRKYSRLGDRLCVGTSGGVWITDGTPAGTLRLASFNATPDLFAEAGPLIYFSAVDSHGAELWATDGTVAGTRMVRDIGPGANTFGPHDMTFWNGFVYFVHTDQAGGIGEQVWRTDGTAAGTTRVMPPIDGGHSNPHSFTPYRGRLYFGASTLNGEHLFSTDGTESGTRIEWANLRVVKMTSAGDKLVIFGDYARTGNYLILSDGTFEGSDFTVQLLSNDGAIPFEWQEVGGTKMFAMSTVDRGREYWLTDGSLEGTRPAVDPPLPAPAVITAAWLQGDWLLLSVRTINPTVTRAYRYTLATRTLEPVTGYEGQEADGSLFADPMAVSGRRLYFNTPYTEVRVTEGGPPRSLAAFTPAQVDSQTRFLQPLNPSTVDVAFGAAGLWRVDDSGATPVAGPVRPSQPYLDGTVLYFAADGQGGGVEPWTMTGTAALRLGDLSTSSSSPEAFVRAGGRVYFSAVNAQGRELWSTLGTPASTQRVVDLWPGGAWGVQSLNLGLGGSSMGVLGGEVLFPGAAAASNYELWRSDGTAAGTRLLAELNPGSSPSSPSAFVTLGDFTYFVAVGSARVYRVRAGGVPELVFRAPGQTGVRQIASTGGALFILSGPSQGPNQPAAPSQLWAVLDPAFGAVRVAEVSASGAFSTATPPMIALADTGWVALVADTLETGQEIMLSRGVGPELGGTRMVELAPGPGSSRIRRLAATDDALYVAGTDGEHGEELFRAWYADLGVAPACPADFNRDGFMDFFDYAEYVSCFELGVCPPSRTADFNRDGFADFFDYADFVGAFEAGC